MDRDPDELIERLEIEIEKLRAERGGQYANAIRQIIEINLSPRRKRLQKHLALNPDQDAAGYLRVVSVNYDRHHEALTALQRGMDEEGQKAWFTKIYSIAKTYFSRKKFAGDFLLELACGSANEAFIALHQAHYTYDVELDAWLVIFVRNICRKHLRDYYGPITINVEDMFGLQDPTEPPEEILIRDESERRQRLTLVDCINTLPPRRRQLIILRYAIALSFQEIADLMETTENAIYQLHLQAKKQLKECAEKNGKAAIS